MFIDLFIGLNESDTITGAASPARFMKSCWQRLYDKCAGSIKGRLAAVSVRKMEACRLCVDVLPAQHRRTS